MLSTEAMVVMEEMVAQVGVHFDLSDVIDALTKADLRDDEFDAFDYAEEL